MCSQVWVVGVGVGRGKKIVLVRKGHSPSVTIEPVESKSAGDRVPLRPGPRNFPDRVLNLFPEKVDGAHVRILRS